MAAQSLNDPFCTQNKFLIVSLLDLLGRCGSMRRYWLLFILPNAVTGLVVLIEVPTHGEPAQRINDAGGLIGSWNGATDDVTQMARNRVTQRISITLCLKKRVGVTNSKKPEPCGEDWGKGQSILSREVKIEGNNGKSGSMALQRTIWRGWRVLSLKFFGCHYCEIGRVQELSVHCQVRHNGSLIWICT